MPPTFPSHQGLVAPLWRRWPGLFDAPALFIGAAMPDIVDALAGIYSGRLGQGIGHSLIALPLLCVPVGLALWWLARLGARHLPPSPGAGFFSRAWNHGLAALRTSHNPGLGSSAWTKIILSLGVGAFSHLFFDLISHGAFTWFYPWQTKVEIFPSWWHIAWMRNPLPFYKGYPIGPHFLMWVTLGCLGAYLLFYPEFRNKTRPPVQAPTGPTPSQDKNGNRS